MARRTMEDELAALKSLEREPGRADADALLRAALQSKTNLVIGRAAAVIATLKRDNLAGELAAAFERLLRDPKYPDKGCEAKTAIAKTLYELGSPAGEAVFLNGIAHVQMEGSFGPPVDTATELRGLSALGLVRIGYRDVMNKLADLLADRQAQARCFAARALAYSERPEAALLLRFKLHMGDRETEVTAECISALARLAPTRAAEFLGDFLEDAEPDLRAATAIALGETRQADALELLQRRMLGEPDQDVRKTIVIAVGISRLPAGVDWLVGRIESAPVNDAVAAVEALAVYRRDEATRGRVLAAAGRRTEPAVASAVQRHFHKA